MTVNLRKLLSADLVVSIRAQGLPTADGGAARNLVIQLKSGHRASLEVAALVSDVVSPVLHVVRAEWAIFLDKAARPRVEEVATYDAAILRATAMVKDVIYTRCLATMLPDKASKQTEELSVPVWVAKAEEDDSKTPMETDSGGAGTQGEGRAMAGIDGGERDTGPTQRDRESGAGGEEVTYTSQPGGATGSVEPTIGQTVRLEQEALDAAERVAREAREAREMKEKKAAEANERLDGTRGTAARATPVDERVERG